MAAMLVSAAVEAIEKYPWVESYEIQVKGQRITIRMIAANLTKPALSRIAQFVPNAVA